MKSNQWNPPVQDRDAAVATLPAPAPAINDADFDNVRYRPTPRPSIRPAPAPVARPASPDAGPNPTIQAVHDAGYVAEVTFRIDEGVILTNTIVGKGAHVLPYCVATDATIGDCA